jgi:hypothetical protein
MKLFGHNVSNATLAKSFGKGAANTLGTVFVYALLALGLYVWYRVQCVKTGRCMSDLLQHATTYSRPAQISQIVLGNGNGNGNGSGDAQRSDSSSLLAYAAADDAPGAPTGSVPPGAVTPSAPVGMWV